MLVRRRPAWALSEAQATSESLYLSRRRLLKAGTVIAGAGVSGLGSLALLTTPAAADIPPERAALYPVDRNPAFPVPPDHTMTDEALATQYNNFYEFGSHKNVWQQTKALPTAPWPVQIDGLVERQTTIDADALIRRMPLEERVYRFRCVEAWAMTVPWSGFPLRALVDFARPLGSAKYLRMQTFLDSTVAPGQRQFWYPWPYTEGLTIAEATNDLAFIATGLYGKPIPEQNGAPLRLAVPWKYGFKSVKSIVRFTFTEKRPTTFWEEIQSSEYGFWANVNPEVAHPRWSQASERVLGEDERRPTLPFNGYADQVAGLYTGLEDRYGDRLYR